MKFAPNQIELAKALGVHRSTVARWLRTPGCPGARADGRLELAPWRRWAAQHARNTPPGTEAHSRKERLEETQIKRWEHRLRVEQRQHVPIAEVSECAAKLRRGVECVIRQLHSIAPDIEGRNKVEIETKLRAEEDRLIAALFTLEP